MVLSALHNFAAFLLIDSSIVRIFMSKFLCCYCNFYLKNCSQYEGQLRGDLLLKQP